MVQSGAIPVGTFPAILGHEGCGIVRRVGTAVPQSRIKVGQAVLLTFSSCRTCSFCTRGSLGSCPGMTEINFAGGRLTDGSSPARLAGDGRPVRAQFFGQSSFSKLAVVRERSVVPLDADLDVGALGMLAPLGCGYNTGASTVFNVLRPNKDASLAITGTGAVGFAALMAAKALGVGCIIAVDLVASKLEMAKELGATHTIDSSDGRDIATAIRELVPGGVDHIVETSGVMTVIEQGVTALGHGGTMALVGVPRPGQRLSIDPMDLLLSCKRLVGVIAGASDPHESLRRLTRLYEAGEFPVDRLGKLYPVAKFHEAIEDLKAGRVVKPILCWEDIHIQGPT